MKKAYFGFQWHITNLCNNNCYHCYQANSEKQNDELSIEQLKFIANNILLSMPKLQFEINITGGEPFIYPNLYELLTYLNDYSNLTKINIITNALCIDQKLLKNLTKLEKVKSIKISLESSDPIVNDNIRGNGSYVRTIYNIKKIQDLDKFDIVLMVTLSKANFKNIPNIIYFAQENKLNGIIFERFIPLGRSKNNSFSSMALSNTEWLQSIIIFLKSVKLLSTKFIKIHNFIHHPSILLELAPIKAFSIKFKYNLPSNFIQTKNLINIEPNTIIPSKPSGSYTEAEVNNTNNKLYTNKRKNYTENIHTCDFRSNNILENYPFTKQICENNSFNIINNAANNYSECKTDCKEYSKNNEQSNIDDIEVAYCNLGKNSMAVMPNGTVYPCRRLEIPIGNLLQEKFSVIRRKLCNWSLSNIKNHLLGKNCKLCKIKNCKGCRAISNAIYNNPYLDDPMCFIKNYKE